MPFVYPKEVLNLIRPNIKMCLVLSFYPSHSEPAKLNEPPTPSAQIKPCLLCKMRIDRWGKQDDKKFDPGIPWNLALLYTNLTHPSLQFRFRRRDGPSSV